MQNKRLNTPIEYLKGVGPKRAEMLNKELGIFTFGDLLEHFPFRYVDKTQIHAIIDLRTDMPVVQVQGKIMSMQVIGEGRKKRMVAFLNDGTAILELVWFKGISYLKSYIKNGNEYRAFGTPSFKYGKLSMAHPDMELVSEENNVEGGRFEAVYPSTEKLKARGLDSKGIFRLMKTLWERITPSDLPEMLPDTIIQSCKLINRFEAYQQIHIPQNNELLQKARYRLKFEEFFFIQLNILQIKVSRQSKHLGYPFHTVGNLFNGFFKQLPFQLTGAQKRVIKEIRIDTLPLKIDNTKARQMNRLLQGDVGSGKTIVGLMTMLLAIDNGFQACLMAPTEILAQQHFNSISKMLDGLSVNVDILTGSIKGKKRRNLLEKLQLGMINILIGTHALIEDTVVFRNLGMVIIDEQHRFGVAQRAKLWTKNDLPPHVLVMTATPIPRTLAMTVYGDLDVSIIDELPPGRKPIETAHYYESKRLMVFNFLKKQIAAGRQVYIVYPLIEESEVLDYKNLMQGYEAISRVFPAPQYQVSVVHGQMGSDEKEYEMQRFKNKETQIMIATTVIEVGVDVPNASVIVIESAERFGLAQLHQLRGRVGRGGNQSYCILMTGNKISKEGKVRMETMVNSTDGFKISEVDMKLRGPGNIAGKQQSGLVNMKLADLIKDNKILQMARNVASDLVNNDPYLTSTSNKALKTYLENSKNKGRTKWSSIS